MNDFWVEKFINEAVPKIIQEFQPDQILLFGSRVNGTATEESDCDLFRTYSSLNVFSNNF